MTKADYTATNGREKNYKRLLVTGKRLPTKADVSTPALRTLTEPLSLCHQGT